MIQQLARMRLKHAPSKINKVRGGQDVLSGTCALSKTFTLGVSLTSCTLASSYALVKSSNTVSSIFTRRYSSAYCSVMMGNCRKEGYRASGSSVVEPA